MEYHIAMESAPTSLNGGGASIPRFLKRQGRESRPNPARLRRPVAQRARPARLSLRVAANVGEEGGSAPSPRFGPDRRNRPSIAQTLEPEGYRLDDYRALTPETVPGGVVIDTEAAYKLWEAACICRRPPGTAAPRELPPQALWMPVPRRNSGKPVAAGRRRGALSPELETFFTPISKTPSKVSATPIVFYCLADCWMSWNATSGRRAGIQAALLYRDGIDAWEAASCRPRTPSPSRGRDCESTPICHSKRLPVTPRAQAPRRASRSTGAWHA